MNTNRAQSWWLDSRNRLSEIAGPIHDTLRHCDVISTRLAEYHLFRAQRLGESQSNLVELRSPSAREPSLGLGAATTSIKLFVQIP